MHLTHDKKEDETLVDYSDVIVKSAIKAIEQKFLSGKSMASSDLAVIPGHLIVYTKKEYISHI